MEVQKKYYVAFAIGVMACTALAGCGKNTVAQDTTQEVEETEIVTEVESMEYSLEDVGTAIPEGSDRPYLNDLTVPEGVDYLIGDDNFVTDTDELYTYIHEFQGYTLQYEGMFTEISDNYFSIVRLYDYAHEDHSHEIYVGLDIDYDGQYPEDGTWVRATGTIEGNDPFGDGESYPILRITELEEIPAGQEKVYN